MTMSLGNTFGYQSSDNNGTIPKRGYFGAFSDSTTQTFPANTISAFKLNTIELSNGVSLEGLPQTKIKLAHAGVYNLQFSAQLNHTTGGLAVFSIWLRKNGVDIPVTCTDVTIESNNTKIVPAWNFLIEVNENDYLELMCSATDDHCEIYFSPERVLPTRPALPSLIVTVTQV